MDISERKKTYDEFIGSPEWKAVRAAFLENKKACMMCGAETELTPHHRKYEEGVKGYCNFDNLVPLCRTCHNNVHLLDNEIRMGWSKLDYVMIKHVVFRLLVFRRAYEHGACKRLVTNLYMKSLIQNIPYNTLSLETKVKSRTAESGYKSCNFYDVLMEALNQISNVDVQRGDDDGDV